ncbi:hypothetical protein [Cognatishimia sp.]|uniref:hypothetical protein n=1 Tax=Cognatishimia sp. TaxID=2211648 RepID=UPI003514A9A0|nr:hypothetical protein [Cognatishimia sp.]
MAIKLYGDTDTESIDIADFLTAKNITMAEITDAIFVVKQDSYSDVILMSKTITDTGLVKDDANKALLINYLITDFGENKLEAKNKYFMAMALEYNDGQVRRTEIPFEDPYLKIVEDQIDGW